jgi:ADP-ribose pyrophosphatase
MTQEKQNKKCAPHVIEHTISYSGKWLKFGNITYKDFMDKTRTWETVQRTSGRGAAVMIATLRPSQKLVLIRQFRPPVDNYVIEFPAGLIDEGEDAAASALRELKEETGYVGKITNVTTPVYNSPGLSDETVSIVSVDIDETAPPNINPESCNEGTEDIEVFLVERDMLAHFLNEREKTGDKIDSKLMIFAIMFGNRHQ